jgi:hypothetical protein
VGEDLSPSFLPICTGDNKQTMKKVFSTHELLLLVALTPAKFGESIHGTIYVFLHSYAATREVQQVMLHKFEV